DDLNQSLSSNLSVANTLHLECVIVDPLYHKEKVAGDVVVLTGYNTARDQMILEAKQLKENAPGTIVIGSGVDVQVNWKHYENSAFDYLIASNRLSDFKRLIEQLATQTRNTAQSIPIIIHSDKLTAFEMVKPSRDYFDQIKHQTRYLLYDNVALVKRAHSCPYGCEFCFCTKLNQGHYVSRSFEMLRLEMETINADTFWVVDDVFIHNREEAASFIETFRGTSYKMIVYLRADFIVSHADLMAMLKNAGIVEVIVGFESIEASVLENYHKGYTPDINTKAIAVLNDSGMSFTALFMLDIGAELQDFKALKTYIKEMKIRNYTFSIFTPLEGTDLYKVYEKDIIDFNSAHYDFLHLVLKPLKMRALTFKLAFAQLFVFQFFHAKSARQFIRKWLKDIVRNIVKTR
ncbi:MAG TPA: radical SAM protein, partial [Fusibacter sp.]|nr:radical SAM protein [Fusibacter sp.]